MGQELVYSLYFVFGRFKMELYVQSATRNSLVFRWTIPYPPENSDANADNDVTHHTVLKIPSPTYRLRYQAMDSSVVQYSNVIDASSQQHLLAQLHENTYYKVCLTVTSALGSGEDDIIACTRASTTTDSLAVVLGSTFGAFVTLGLVVFFVFIARWQHERRLRKRYADCLMTQRNAAVIMTQSDHNPQQSAAEGQNQRQDQRGHRETIENATDDATAVFEEGKYEVGEKARSKIDGPAGDEEAVGMLTSAAVMGDGNKVITVVAVVDIPNSANDVQTNNSRMKLPQHVACGLRQFLFHN
jgi:hypothetical protein